MNTTQTHILDITDEKAERIITDSAKEFQASYPQYKIKLQQMQRKTVRTGHTYGLPTEKPSQKTVFDKNFHETCRVTIGTKGITENVPDALFVRLMATTQHELRHIYQAIKSSTITDPSEQLMSIQRLAMRNNPTLYEFNQTRLISELDADSEACRATTKYIRNQFQNINQNDIDTIVTQGYLMYYGQHGQIILPGDGYPKTANELQTALENAKQNAISQKVKFPEKYEKSGDELTYLTKLKNKKWDFVYNDIVNESDPIQTYTKMACLQCYLHPYMQAHYPNTFEIDLSPKEVFGYDLPEPREAVIKQLPTFYLEPYEIREKLPKIIQSHTPEPKTILNDPTRKPRDTSDLDRAVTEINQQSISTEDQFE